MTGRVVTRSALDERRVAGHGTPGVWEEIGSMVDVMGRPKRDTRNGWIRYQADADARRNDRFFGRAEKIKKCGYGSSPRVALVATS